MYKCVEKSGKIESVAGKDTLPQQVKDTCMKYHQLSTEDKEQLVNKFTKVQKPKAIRAVENKLHNLQHYIGAETIMYTMCGTTDITLQEIAFMTGGMKYFMRSVMGVDNNDLISKMKGFVVQEIKEMITSDSKAKMQWPYYF
ncbi:hypothetical protein HD554DRAFT_2034909 [Boletus coccyginus]|nr:hypothetical protein HD554DRAFT_2034909 [Boletus coccyginus]